MSEIETVIMQETASPLHSDKVLRKLSCQANTFQIKTKIDGYNSGRIYYLRSSGDNESLCSNLVGKLVRTAEAARKRKVVLSRFKRIQTFSKKIHQTFAFQSAVALLICVVSLCCVALLHSVLRAQKPMTESGGAPQNFAVNATESQLADAIVDSHGALTPLGEQLELIDSAFTAVFTAELLFNALCSWFPAFLQDGWNIFDLATVSLSLLALALGSNKLPVNIIRSVRAFRILRVMGKLQSLKNIVAALSASVLPVPAARPPPIPHRLHASPFPTRACLARGRRAPVRCA